MSVDGTVSKRQLFILAGVFLLCAIVIIVVYLCIHWWRSSTPTALESGIESVPLITETGERLDVEAIRHKPLVIATWATWCGNECVRALEVMAEMQKQYGEQVEFLAVNRKEDQHTIASYRESVVLPQGIRYVNDFTDAYIKNIDGHAMPEVVVYTSTGALAAHLIAAPSSEELRGYIETALVEK